MSDSNGYFLTWSGSRAILLPDYLELNRTVLTADVATTGTGTGGNLTIDTQRLLVQGGTQLSASTFGQGKGGSLQITASDAVEVIGTSADNQTISGLFAESSGSGNAGDLRIETPRLRVRNGAGVSVNTFGQGKGGSLQITASDAVEVIGRSADGRRPSGLSAQSIGSGDAGNLTIDTGRLLVQGGAGVLASTFVQGWQLADYRF